MRPIIEAFAEAMEEKLQRNDWKPEWRGKELTAILLALRAEVAELDEAIYSCWERDTDSGLEAFLEAIRLEAADVALYAMILADMAGALPETTNRGRVLVSQPITFTTARMATAWGDA